MFLSVFLTSLNLTGARDTSGRPVYFGDTDAHLKALNESKSLMVMRSIFGYGLEMQAPIEGLKENDQQLLNIDERIWCV